MKKLLLLCIFALAMGVSHAQYKHSLGVGFGSPTGIQYKGFLNDKNAVDLLLGWNPDYFNLSGLYEWHFPIANEWKWYVGPGAFLGSREHAKDNKNEFFFGLLGAVGVEFKPNIPLVFSLDFRPSLSLIGGDNYYNQFVLGVRYVFK